MCLLLNYALANLHVATEKAVGECGETINHRSHSSVRQSRIERGDEINWSFPLAVMVRIRNLKDVIFTVKVCLC